MRYRFLGRSGLAVSELCLGAMTFGRESDEPSSRQMLDRFVEAGGTFIDTADVYGNGASEEILGRWLHGRDRAELVLATKVRWGPGGNREGLGRKHIIAGLEASLRRLGTDHVDLYQVHGWDPATPVEQVMRSLDTAVSTGKVRHLGVSNWAAWQIQKALGTAGARGWEPFVCLQPLYNLLDREAEWELVPLSLDAGMGIIPWSPLRGGWLTGRYTRGMGGAPGGTRVGDASAHGWGERWEEYDTEHTWRVLDELQAVAAESGREPAQVAVNWLLQRPGVTAPIIGARTLEQLESTLGAAGWDLDPVHVERLSAVSRQRPPYPHSMIAGAGRTPDPR